MTLKKFTFLMYLQKFFAEFNPIYPLYALMFVEYGGLSATEVSILFFIWFTTAFLSEIPTGIVADKISRRDSSIIGRFFLMATFIIWLLFPTFIGFTLGFILWGIGFAFTSGATDSYLFEEIKKLGGGQNFTKLYSKATTLKVFGMFCAYVLANVLIPYGYQTILMVSIGVSFIVPIILILMPRDSMSHMRHRSHFSILTEAAQTIKSKSNILKLSVFLMFLGGAVGMVEEYAPLYYSWNGFSTEEVLTILMFGLLGATVIQMTSHFFDRYTQKVLFGIVALVGLFFFSTSFFHGWIAALGFYAFIRLMKLMDTSLTARIHTQFESDARSTVFSLITFIAEIIAIVATGIIIILQTQHSDIFSVSLLGLGVFIMSIVFITQIDKTTE